MKRVSGLLLWVFVPLVIIGCVSQAEIRQRVLRETDQKDERLYGSAVTLQELREELHGKAARATSGGYGTSCCKDSTWGSFAGRWVGHQESRSRHLRRSEVDGKYRQHMKDTIVEVDSVYEFSPNGRMTWETHIGIRGKKHSSLVKGTWSFEAGRINFTVDRGNAVPEGCRNPAYVGWLRQDGTLEVQERDLKSNVMYGEVLDAFYDNLGSAWRLREYLTHLTVETTKPRIFRLVERFRAEDPPEEDVRLSRAVMLKNLGQLRDSGVITEEEYKKERRKIEAGGK